MEVVQEILAVMLVFGLLGLAVWRLRAPGSGMAIGRGWSPGKTAPAAIESMERVPLTPQHAMHRLRIHGRELVVVTHPQGCSFLPPSDRFLSELDDGESDWKGAPAAVGDNFR